MKVFLLVIVCEGHFSRNERQTEIHLSSNEVPNEGRKGISNIPNNIMSSNVLGLRVT